MALAACARQPEETHDFYSEVRSVDRLVLAQMTISKMATVDDLRLEDARGPRQTAAKAIARHTRDREKRFFIAGLCLVRSDMSDVSDKSEFIKKPPVGMMRRGAMRVSGRHPVAGMPSRFYQSR